jgi:hypothetical protein
MRLWQPELEHHYHYPSDDHDSSEDQDRESSDDEESSEEYEPRDNRDDESSEDESSDSDDRNSDRNSDSHEETSEVPERAPGIQYSILEYPDLVEALRRQESLRLALINSLSSIHGQRIHRGGDETAVCIMPKTVTDKAGVERSRPLYSVVNDDKKRVAYFYDSDIGNYAYVTGHPMKPHRIRLAHSLVMNYDVYKYLEIYVSRSHFAVDGLLRSLRCAVRI